MLHDLETGLTFTEQHTHIQVYWIHLTLGVILLFSAREETERVLSGLRWVWIGFFFPYLKSIIFLKGKPGRGKASKPFTIPFRCSLLFQFTGCNSDAFSDTPSSWVRIVWWTKCKLLFHGPAKLVLHRQRTAQPLFNLCLLQCSENPQSWFGRWVVQLQH